MGGVQAARALQIHPYRYPQKPVHMSPWPAACSTDFARCSINEFCCIKRIMLHQEDHVASRLAKTHPTPHTQKNKPASARTSPRLIPHPPLSPVSSPAAPLAHSCLLFNASSCLPPRPAAGFEAVSGCLSTNTHPPTHPPARAHTHTRRFPRFWRSFRASLSARRAPNPKHRSLQRPQRTTWYNPVDIRASLYTALPPTTVAVLWPTLSPAPQATAARASRASRRARRWGTARAVVWDRAAGRCPGGASRRHVVSLEAPDTARLPMSCHGVNRRYMPRAALDTPPRGPMHRRGSSVASSRRWCWVTGPAAHAPSRRAGRQRRASFEVEPGDGDCGEQHAQRLLDGCCGQRLLDGEGCRRLSAARGAPRRQASVTRASSVLCEALLNEAALLHAAHCRCLATWPVAAPRRARWPGSLSRRPRDTMRV